MLYVVFTYSMKLSVLQEDLTQSSSLASRFVSTKAQLPILANIKLSAKEGKLALGATNLETGIHLVCGAKVEEEGEITVPAKILVDLVGNLPAGRVELLKDKDQLQVSAGPMSATISGIPATEFPKIPQKAEESTFTIKKEAFALLAKQVSFAASSDEGRPILTGIFVEIGERVVAVATDGFRMSAKDLKSEQFFKTEGSGKKNFLLPARTISELDKSLPKDVSEITVEVREKEGQLIFDAAHSLVLTARTIEGTFPDYKKVMPKEWGTKVRIGREELTRAVKASGVFARESGGIVKIKFEKEGLLLSSESNQYGKEEVGVEGEFEGQEAQVAFNYRYILEFLGSVGGQAVEIRTLGPTSPALFLDPQDTSYTHVIMPVRIST